MEYPLIDRLDIMFSDNDDSFHLGSPKPRQIIQLTDRAGSYENFLSGMGDAR